nr:MAG TPA: hypothetical protein [Caudoviricetes sp.]
MPGELGHCGCVCACCLLAPAAEPISPRAFFLRACAREGASGDALPRTIWQWEGVAEKQGARSLVCIVISSFPMYRLSELFPLIPRWGSRKTRTPLIETRSEIFQKLPR